MDQLKPVELTQSTNENFDRKRKAIKKVKSPTSTKRLKQIRVKKNKSIPTSKLIQKLKEHFKSCNCKQI